MENTSHSDIEGWIVELERLEASKYCDSPKFLKPFHFATITHTLRKHNPTQLTVPEKIATYANTMGLWSALKIESPHGPVNRNTAGRYLPLVLLEDEATVDDVAYKMIELFRPVCTDDKTLDAVCTMLRELIGNCFAHSAVKDGLHGVICGQVWSAGRKAQIALVDSGIGIRGSLQQNEKLFARLEGENACELATEYGVTSKPGRGHSGYGLVIARKLLEQNEGVLYLRSGREVFWLINGKVTSMQTSLPWNGTLLVIEWNIDKAMDIGQVYSEFPQVEGMTDDDFDF